MFVYGACEVGVVTVIDFSNGPENAEQIDFVLQFENTLTDVEVCGKFLFVASKDDPNNGTVSIYSTAQRVEGTGDLLYPQLIAEVMVGAGPDMIFPNPTCDILGTKAKVITMSFSLIQLGVSPSSRDHSMDLWK